MIIDEQMWKQALAYAAGSYLNKKVTPQELVGEAELFERDELDPDWLPVDSSSILPVRVVGYVYGIAGTDLIAYSLVGLESETLYLMGLFKGGRLVWFEEG
ncbi:hypothetical protein [Levilactobacillus yiduensis]|uniref:hypothetical protein n=1 Tax=Levilactobacillus yiduensis TaxID=2953880 RepID=UPI000EF326E5|nr:hypothetical protein [Levilactobacillus yiduensis]AYM01489.1 hypothetical protein D8911_00225 [Levilactobacillus brevis]